MKENNVPVDMGQARFLTCKEAGLYLGGRSGNAVRMMIRRGHFPLLKMGTRTYVDKLELDRFMNQNHQALT